MLESKAPTQLTPATFHIILFCNLNEPIQNQFYYLRKEQFRNRNQIIRALFSRKHLNLYMKFEK